MATNANTNHPGSSESSPIQSQRDSHAQNMMVIVRHALMQLKSAGVPEAEVAALHKKAFDSVYHTNSRTPSPPTAQPPQASTTTPSWHNPTWTFSHTPLVSIKSPERVLDPHAPHITGEQNYARTMREPSPESFHSCGTLSPEKPRGEMGRDDMEVYHSATERVDQSYYEDDDEALLAQEMQAQEGGGLGGDGGWFGGGMAGLAQQAGQVQEMEEGHGEEQGGDEDMRQ
ncbi:hypothetical protein CONLIGDRAFT_686714 [Coniochaeta ligniaria NRRL 30616]|uniref:Uncharacterized protein n=1 Tax=Coniochaeta ligniaria NRRL 30616 TaxID=1408157 RepID=A0A1J7J288_9PEZI|nr:hypothetical protein CONLIGDRAFT_686714 [Coniochaeta ligniaria NRRL 30616]